MNNDTHNPTPNQPIKNDESDPPAHRGALKELVMYGALDAAWEKFSAENSKPITFW